MYIYVYRYSCLFELVNGIALHAYVNSTLSKLLKSILFKYYAHIYGDKNGGLCDLKCIFTR